MPAGWHESAHWAPGEASASPGMTHMSGSTLRRHGTAAVTRSPQNMARMAHMRTGLAKLPAGQSQSTGQSQSSRHTLLLILLLGCPCRCLSSFRWHQSLPDGMAAQFVMMSLQRHPRSPLPSWERCQGMSCQSCLLPWQSLQRSRFSRLRSRQPRRLPSGEIRLLPPRLLRKLAATPSLSNVPMLMSHFFRVLLPRKQCRSSKVEPPRGLSPPRRKS